MSVQVKTHHPSGTVILNRPDKGNALSRESIGALIQAMEDLRQERKVRAAILTGAGDVFCAGLDLAEMEETSQAENAQEMWYHDVVQYKELMETMLRFPKPIIAAVNGPAVAAGAGLVLACDLVLAGPTAQFGFPEPRRGLVAGLVSPLLAFRLGGSQAARLLLTAQEISAEEAHRLGAYHELVKTDMLWARAHDLAGEVARSAPEALQLTKRMLNETVGEHLGTLMSAGAAVSATSRTTEAAQEGLAAFLEKRDPDWP